MTEMSRERRERLLEEMHEMGDSRVVTDDPNRLESFTSPLTYGELRALLSDSARLERAQKVVDDLKNDPDPDMRDVANDIERAIVDTGAL